MIPDLLNGAAGDVFGIAVTVGLTFVLGLEREEAGARSHAAILAGVRTIPVVGLLGHALALLSPNSLLPVALGFGVVGAFLLVGYWHLLQHERIGLTSECTVLVAYMVGAMVAHGRTSAAAALTVATVMLLTGKQPLRRFATRVPPYEITTFVTFLLLAGVILPVLPNQEFTRFQFNPFKIWLMVVAVSGISYASYALQKVTRAENSLLLTALLGGLYSSTATTVALARRAARAPAGFACAGAIILASGTMYIRLLIVVWAFAGDVVRQLAPALIGLAVLGSAAGVALIVWSRQAGGAPGDTGDDVQHPLEIRAGVLFAALFLGLTIATQLTTQYLGGTWLLALAVIVGFADILPFILGIAAGVGSTIPVGLALTAILVSIASNNLLKGVYALALGGQRTGRWAFAGLSALAVLTVLARALM